MYVTYCFSHLETHLRPAVLDHANTFLTSIRTKSCDFQTNLSRFESILATKEKLNSGLLDEVDINVEDADLYSDTTSMTGVMSNISGVKSHPDSLKTR